MLPLQRVLRHYPFHTIMCWGHSSRSFLFRLFSRPEPELRTVTLGTPEVRNARGAAALVRR